MIYIIKKNIPEAIWFLQVSIEIHPFRLESYFHLMCLYMDHKLFIPLKLFRKEAKKIYDSNPDTKDFLFYEKKICQNEIIQFF